VKHIHGNGFIFGATVAILVAQIGQPALAQTTQITGVKLNQVDGKVNLVLDASSGDRAQVFTTKRGNALVADIINTQLRIPQGNSFRQDNPGPGIASIAINQLDSNSVRVVVTGSKGTPNTQPVVRGRDGLTISFIEGDGTVAAVPEPSAPTAPAAPPTGISQQPAPAEGPGQPNNAAPPFLPRAVAPPVGDIAISAIDASPSVIDLGTQERVPRLVLRDAPVREVLSLLARAANMNLAYSSVDASGQGGQPAAAVPGEGLKVSLDIQNEPVQDVFNYVLRLSGLEANRSGRTIFVGPRLPNSSRDVVMRNLRLNQVTVDVALNFLVGLGADSAVSRERQVTSVSAIPVGQGVNPVTQSQTTTETKIERLTLEDSKYSSPLLRGLQALGDQRSNSITLIGTPKQVELAMAQLSQLDIRRRQVAVNVKIVDVNLTNIKDFGSSFSFGVGDSYFVNNGGAASLNFGGSQPATNNGGSISNGANLSGLSNRFLSSLQAQVQNQNAKILTDPTLIVQEGETASVNLTQQVVGNFKREISRGDGASTETITVEKENIGLTLAVKVDRIDDNGFISLSVAPNVKAPQAPENISLGSGGGSQRIFLVSERSLNSGIVRLRDGQTLVLSGIIQDQDRTTVSKIPILGDIPLLGSLFRKTNRNNQRNEVIVLLTPQVMDDSERSSYGYNYNPSPEVRQMLERRGLQVPKK
jgi:type IV pilus assembly protein PilQ